MALTICRGCHEEVEENVDVCPQCGLSFLVASEAVLSNSPIRAIAIGQKWVIYSILLQVLSFFVMYGLLGREVMPLILFYIWIFVFLFQLVSVCKLEIALGVHPLLIAISSIVLLLPCVSLIALLVINQMGTSELKKAGVKVGFMGAKMETLPPVQT